MEFQFFQVKSIYYLIKNFSQKYNNFFSNKNVKIKVLKNGLTDLTVRQ
jgi:hypothetical protein